MTQKQGQKPQLPRGCVGAFTDPRTNQKIFVFPKRGENAAAAMRRVRRNHGVAG